MVTGQSDTVVVILAILGFLTTTMTAVLAAFVAIKTGEVKKEVKSTHDLVNGMTAELRTSEASRAGAEGFTAGEAAERGRTGPLLEAPQEVTIVNPEPVDVRDVGPAP